MARGGTPGQADAVRAAADELYGLPLEQFTAARNDKAKQVRGQGDGEAAAEIAKLAKPSTVAWLANHLARQHADQVGRLLELGESMRRATAVLDAGQLRQLSAQQHQVVQILLQRAHGLADAAGLAFSASTARGLEDTLHAALADEVSARRLAQGRLTSGLSHSGFPGILAGPQGAGAWQVPATQPRQGGSGRVASVQAGLSGQAERARQDEARARRDAEQAGRVRAKAHDDLATAEQAAREAADKVAELRAALDAALAARAEADSARRQARQDVSRADMAARQAERRLADATARREDRER